MTYPEFNNLSIAVFTGEMISVAFTITVIACVAIAYGLAAVFKKEKLPIKSFVKIALPLIVVQFAIVGVTSIYFYSEKVDWEKRRDNGEEVYLKDEERTCPSFPYATSEVLVKIIDIDSPEDEGHKVSAGRINDMFNSLRNSSSFTPCACAPDVEIELQSDDFTTIQIGFLLYGEHDYVIFKYDEVGYFGIKGSEFKKMAIKTKLFDEFRRLWR